MTLEQLSTTLESIEGFSGKVVYYAWPEGQAPALPFICYLENGSNGFAADGISFYASRRIDIELYTRLRDMTSEGAVEAALTEASIYWSKEINYIDSEKCYQITYEVEI